MSTTTRPPATIHAADLAPGDRFVSPNTGRTVEVYSLRTIEGELVVSVVGGGFVNLDPTHLVNLEA